MGNDASQPSGPDGHWVTLEAAIFDVDGVLVASPHEQRGGSHSLASPIPPASPPHFTRQTWQGSQGWKGHAPPWNNSAFRTQQSVPWKMPRSSRR